MATAYDVGVKTALETLGLRTDLNPTRMRSKLAAGLSLPPSLAEPSRNLLRNALGGAVAGGVAGNVLAPEDRKGTGFFYGAGLGGAGALLGRAAAPLMHDARSIQSAAGRQAIPAVSTGLGTLAGIGASQALINKDIPDTSENPYRY